MGIQIVRGPLGGAAEAPGPLSLPIGFDRKKWAPKWVKVGPSVQAASEREWMPGASATADGWEVWRNSEGKPQKVALLSGEHILLCRSRVVQDAVNAIYGNVGKSRLRQERTGETIAGAAPSDPGQLSDARIAKVAGKEEQEEGDIAMNPVPDTNGQRIELPPLATMAAKPSGTRIVRRA